MCPPPKLKFPEHTTALVSSYTAVVNISRIKPMVYIFNYLVI